MAEIDYNSFDHSSQKTEGKGKVWGRRLFIFGTPLALALGLLYVYIFDPVKQGQFFIPCFFLENFGLYCPGCGNTRALHSLLHLEIGEVFHFNLLFPFLAFILGWLLVGEYLRVLLGRRVLWLPKRVHPVLLGIAVLVVVAYTVARNLPFYPFYLLAP